MQTLLKKVDAIELKARQLIHKMERLERDNEFLLKENISLKKDIKQYIDKIEGLQKLIIPENDDNFKNKETVKQSIVDLAKEVEMCINLLNT
jgi:hypothetical protein